MNCANCGNELPPRARVCPNCGTPVPNVFPTPPVAPLLEQTVYSNFAPFQESGPANPPAPAIPNNAAQQGPPAMPQESYATGYGIPSPPGQYQPPAQQPFPPNQQPFQFPAQQPPSQQTPFMDFGSPQQPPASGMSIMPPYQQQPFMPGSQQPFAQPGQPQYPQQQSYPGFPQQPSFPGMPPQQFSDTTQQNVSIGNPPSFPGVPPQQPPFPGQPGQFGQPGQYEQFGQPRQLERPAPQQRPLGLIIALIVVAVLVIIGGSGLIYYVGVARPAQLSAQATATAVNEAQGTAASIAHATSTVQAQANATVTAVAVATVQVQATTTAYMSMYTQATSGTPALNDPLTKNDANSWYTYSNSNGACAFTGGALHVTGTVAFCTAQATNFVDFAFQTKITVLKGSSSVGGGLMFRINFNGATVKYYLFGIGADGSYSLILIQEVNSQPTVNYLTKGNSPAITQGLNQTNTVAILARGSNFYLYANNQFITQFSDSSSAAGAIGLFGLDNTKGMDVAFSNAELWQA